VLDPHRAPVDELILTVLSQNTNDRNRDVAYGRLRERFPGGWPEVRDAPAEEVEEAIRPGGLSNTKAARIGEILRALGDDDLAWLETAPLEEARAFLTALPGVGRKTAACVLLFSFGRPDVPVDTHVFRVGGRLGLFRPGGTLDEAHDELTRLAGGNPTTPTSCTWRSSATGGGPVSRGRLAAGNVHSGGCVPTVEAVRRAGDTLCRHRYDDLPY